MTIIDRGLKFGYTPGYRTQNTELILHHAAGNGSVEAIHNYHLSLGWAGIAYHFYVRKDGNIYRGRPEAWLGGHTTNHSNAIGICFEGNFELESMSDAQTDSGRKLVTDVLGRYPGIKVYRHSQLNTTACPGRLFPFDAIVNPLSEEPEDTDAEGGGPSVWAAESCEKAIKKGIFMGDDQGDFDWYGNVTREQLAVILDRIGLLD